MNSNYTLFIISYLRNLITYIGILPQFLLKIWKIKLIVRIGVQEDMLCSPSQQMAVPSWAIRLVLGIITIDMVLIRKASPYRMDSSAEVSHFMAFHRQVIQLLHHGCLLSLQELVSLLPLFVGLFGPPGLHHRHCCLRSDENVSSDKKLCKPHKCRSKCS